MSLRDAKSLQLAGWRTLWKFTLIANSYIFLPVSCSTLIGHYVGKLRFCLGNSSIVCMQVVCKYRRLSHRLILFCLYNLHLSKEPPLTLVNLGCGMFHFEFAFVKVPKPHLKFGVSGTWISFIFSIVENVIYMMLMLMTHIISLDSL